LRLRLTWMVFESPVESLDAAKSLRFKKDMFSFRISLYLYKFSEHTLRYTRLSGMFIDTSRPALTVSSSQTISLFCTFHIIQHMDLKFCSLLKHLR
jgi:hypothetical protein